MSLRLARLCVACCGFWACGANREVEAQQSAARVSRAIEILRDAPNAAKADPLQALTRLACAAPDVCETREVCRAAYTLHVEAVSLTEAAKLQLSAGRPNDAAKVLGSAEAKLTEASHQVATCADRDASLRRRYKL